MMNSLIKAFLPGVDCLLKGDGYLLFPVRGTFTRSTFLPWAHFIEPDFQKFLSIWSHAKSCKPWFEGNSDTVNIWVALYDNIDDNWETFLVFDLF